MAIVAVVIVLNYRLLNTSYLILHPAASWRTEGFTVSYKGRDGSAIAVKVIKSIVNIRIAEEEFC
jgi:hypothetical protein